MLKKFLFAFPVVALASACTSTGGGPLGFVMFDKNRHVPGAGPLFTPGEDRCLSATFFLSVFSNGDAPEAEKPFCSQLRAQMRSYLPFGNLYGKECLTTGSRILTGPATRWSTP
jgi:hypothetical protein